jgi:agmatinase
MHNVAARIPGVSRIVQVGLRDVSPAERRAIEASDGRIRALFDPEIRTRLLRGAPFAEICAPLIESLPESVYVSFDVDGLDPALCPHTGTPVPGGLSFAEASYLLRRVVESGRRIVGFDLCEVAPGPNADDEWDANVGARLLYKLIGWALLSRPRDEVVEKSH